jgi:uncharacterized protein (TIGR03083 family)
MSPPISIVALPARAGKPYGCDIVALVTTPAYARYDIPGYIGALRSEGELLVAAAERAGMAAVVPSCPGWAVRDLLKHTGYVHRWATGFAARGLARPEGGESEAEILSQGPGDAGLPGWFREGHAALVRALGDAPAGLDCWAFLSAPSPLAFWARRQAHETAIHRADAEQAAGDGPPPGAGPAEGPAEAAEGGARASAPSGNAPTFVVSGTDHNHIGVVFEPAFAADGVDELLMGFVARDLGRGGLPGLDGSLAIHAADGPAGGADWLVTGGPAGPAGRGVSRGTGPADCEVTGPAAELYLALWHRRPLDGLAVDGDPGILAAFSSALRITW